MRSRTVIIVRHRCVVSQCGDRPEALDENPRGIARFESRPKIHPSGLVQSLNNCVQEGRPQALVHCTVQEGESVRLLFPLIACLSSRKSAGNALTLCLPDEGRKILLH